MATRSWRRQWRQIVYNDENTAEITAIHVPTRKRRLLEQQQAVETVRCACCGVAEDCTAAYISAACARLRCDCGDWCSSAVKEIVRRERRRGDGAALVAHRGGRGGGDLVATRGGVQTISLATTRLNPTLSLAGSMRRIARGGASTGGRRASGQERAAGAARPRRPRAALATRGSWRK
ncbi:hypothetical protein PR202_gb27027 [Eleusine coracana subsp. coracana]|uniref:Uncharacterized protein n=1 Tax=Eleusine coracana subsp. coracana TaxID=191504 RepID=A0AAV5FSR3_ELECO|nr:hypothetical protein PR202_gb27027 [Eleusine coracana subsp. coracana]